MNLSKQLEYYMKKKGLNILQLSKLSKIPKSTINDWTNRQEPKKLSQVKAVATVLQTSIDNLVFGSKEDADLEKITEIEHLISGEQWLSGLFEVRIRRVKDKGKRK